MLGENTTRRRRGIARLRDRIENIVSAAILTGDVAAGEVLSTAALAKQIGVSATPVREALLNLEKRGFVEAVRNVGFRVTEFDETELREIAAVRRMIEPEAMAQLALLFDAEELPRMRAMAGEIAAGAIARDTGAYLEADHKFHLALTEMLDNRLLVDIVADLRGRTRLTGLLPLLQNKQLDILTNEHDILLDRLAEGDPAGARVIMDRHIGHVVGWWSGKAEAEAPVSD